MGLSATPATGILGATAGIAATAGTARNALTLTEARLGLLSAA